MKCEDKVFRKVAYCYKWTETSIENEYRIQIYNQMLYNEQEEPILELDAIFLAPFPMTFEEFYQMHAYYQPASIIGEIEADDTYSSYNHFIALRLPNQDKYVRMESKEVYYCYWDN